MRTLTPILFGLLIASTAHATGHRTFVAAEGSDSGTCGPSAPCRSLDYALSQTNIGGEIIISSNGGYGNATGGLTIAQSVSIIAAPGVFAALAPTSGDGVTIATSDIRVGLKGLTINSRGGIHGISISNDASVSIENCSLSGFSYSGIYTNSANAKVKVINSVVKDSYGGVWVNQGQASVTGSKFVGNNFGVAAAPANDSVTAKITIADSYITGSSEAILVYTHNTGSTAFVYASNVDVHSNGYGVDVGANGTVIIGGSSFMNSTNSHFYVSGSGVLKSANNNLLDDNSKVFGSVTNASAGMFK